MGRVSVPTKGGYLSVVEEGQGEPMLLLHGWSGDVERQWRGGLFPGAPDALGGLAQSFRVLAPDLRGHGQSVAAEEARDYGRQAVDDLMAVLDFF
ncbi:MAG: alpha/beta fold hydrolase [Armatimonadetes bacterium]|nr:alpha/beta fold hydrolase [Armatimonadota bacterium]